MSDTPSEANLGFMFALLGILGLVIVYWREVWIAICGKDHNRAKRD